MMIPSTPTPESLRLTLATLRNVRGQCSHDEHQLRQLRHILARHVDLPFMPTMGGIESPAKSQATDGEILELMFDALADISGEDEEDARGIASTRRLIAVQLNKSSVTFEGGQFRLH